MTTQNRLKAYLAAEEKVLKGQEVRVGDKWYRRADLSEIRSAITELQRQLAREQSGTGLRFSRANLNRNW